MNVKDIIKSRRIELGLTLDELASKVGVSGATISRWESGEIANMKRDKIVKLANSLDVSPGVIMGWEDVLDEPMKQHYDTHIDMLNAGFEMGSKKIKAIRIPVLGRVQAGLPIEAQEEILDWEEIEPSMAVDGDYFGLQVKGDSMEPKFSEGDVVIVRKQEDAECGSIVIAMVNGNDATIKKLIKYDDGGVALVASNPIYQPMRFSKKDIISKPVAILGKVIELRAKF